MKLLLSGDLHIGRTSSRVPEMVPRESLRTAYTWQRLVDLAVREKVDLVCLSGDVADEANRFYEAIGPLQSGVERLAEASIRTVVVAGNHDHDVLSRLARQLPDEHFTLLGEGGKWERLLLEDDEGHTALHIDGWSFARAAVHEDPVTSYDLPDPAGIPTLGLLHGDLDDPSSRYAPLDAARLQAVAVGGWLLGHIHAPRLTGQAGAPWLLYPGSPQALDPGEPGAHGVWITEVRDGSLATPQLRPLSTVRYETTTIRLDDVETEVALDSAVIDGVRAAAEDFIEESETLNCLSLRLQLVGRTPIASLVDEALRRMTEDLALTSHGVAIAVEKVDNQTLPAIDLQAHADSQAPPGALAHLLLELESGEPSPQTRELVRRTREAIRQVDGHRDFAQLGRADDVDEQHAQAILVQQARRLLTQLVSQDT